MTASFSKQLPEDTMIGPATALPTTNAVSPRSSPASPRGGDESLWRAMHDYEGLWQAPVACLSLIDGSIVSVLHPDMPFLLPPEMAQRIASGEPIAESASGLAWVAAANPTEPDQRLVAMIRTQPQVNSPEVVMSAATLGWTQVELDAWMARLPLVPHGMLQQTSQTLAHKTGADRELASTRREMDQLLEHLEYTYEEISLLHTLTQNLQISRAASELAEMSIERMHGLVKAEGHAIWLDEPNGRSNFYVAGHVPFDELGLAQLVARFDNHDWTRPLVRNRIRGSLLGADFPGLGNLVIVSIAEGTHRSGWLCSCNLSDEREFGTVEARLLGSVASILGTHSRNIDLYQQHDELMLSFVRSLVSSLDAKDPYTRGHSERVALIGRRIGEEMGLPEEDLHDIYLAGLLHDIGKIGVDDNILRKPTQLTDDEFKQIQKHPIIGYHIVSGVKNLQRVIPGVRHHHEAYSGKGYPDSLKGDAIPLMARILAVADSYDAMGSDRPYRKGMPLETLEAILRRGAGEQWDANVIDAYFRCRDDIQRICASYSPEQGNLLRVRDAEDFGELSDVG
ncbi:MAG TPA: HD-GYP domain-containing protein [Planctomycetaceae bacterium]|nr:HD-GYP domain-containing protein [Planctomycetaceae bacterium]